MIKDKIAFWGANENDAECLVIVRLRLADDIIDVWTLPKETITDEFEKKALENTDQIDLTQLPENHTYIERSVMEENLLPDEVKTRNTDLVKLAETQWRVRVLSNKLSQKLTKEIDGLVEQVKSLTEYDNEMWQLTKAFWDKVNNYFQEKDLTREHTGWLRDKINEAFDILKSLRKEANHEARQAVETIQARIQKIMESVSPNQNLNVIFDKLKGLQDESNRLRLAGTLREQLRVLFNDAFTLVKEERQKGNLRRIEHRIRGVKDIIARSEKTIRDDRNDLQFQHNRLKTTDGKLEAQLREAKIKMITTQLEANEAKLKEMQEVLNDLNRQLQQEQKKLEKVHTKEKEKPEPVKQPEGNKHHQKNKKPVKQNKDESKEAVSSSENPVVPVLEDFENEENANSMPAPDIATTQESGNEETIAGDNAEQVSEETTAVEDKTETQDISENSESETPPSDGTPAHHSVSDNHHHFYSPIEESDMELFEEQKEVTPKNSEEFTDGEGLYNFDKEGE